MATGNPDLYDTSTTPDLAGLLGAVLGKEVDQTTNSSQNTTGTTASNTSSNSNQISNQNTNQNTNQASTGVSNTTGTNVGTQNVSGATTNTGTSSTTGTIGRTNNQTEFGTNVEKTDADTAALREVYARQSQGITPEMLAAIFTQGAKAAPQLITANANALGARTAGNTPLAAVLNQLNVDLTGKAADINRQMLEDSGQTANNIANLTKSVTGTNNNSKTSVGEDVQNLLTATDSQQIASQIINSINTSAQQNATANQSTGSQNSTTSGTQSNTANSNTTGTQTQASTATQTQNTQTTINTSVVKNLLGAFVGGVAVDQLFRQATGQGFGGTIVDFAKHLVGQGAKLSDVNAQLVAAGFPIIDAASIDPGAGLPDYDYQPPDYEPPIPDTDAADFGDYGPGGADGGMIRGMADGGIGFLPVPNLLKKKQIISGNPDADMDNLLNSLLGGRATSMSAAGNGEGSANGNTGTNSGDGTTSGSGGNGVGNSGGTGTGTGTAGTGPGPGEVGYVGTGTGTSINSISLGDIATLGKAGLGLASGTPMGIVGAVLGLMGFANKSANTPGQAQFGLESINGPLGAFDATPAQTNAELGITAAPTESFGSMSDIGGMASDGTDSGANDGSGQGTGDSAGDGGAGASNGSDNGNGEGGGWADGGHMIDEDHDYMMEALGITRDKASGSLMFSPQGVKNLHRAIQTTSRADPRSGKPPGMANGGAVRKPAGYNSGGKIVGPGTGVSDSIPARGPAGTPLRVANGEYIIPADVVEVFGASAFDKLVAEHHVPADMQRAITG